MSKKTNAARILDSLHISYELVTYEADALHLSAVHVAATVGVSADTIFKTLVLKGDHKEPVVAVIPGDAALDLKKLAKASGHKNCEMIAVKELQPLTGYIRGGCSPVGMKKLFPTFIDESIWLHDKILVSAGLRGLQLKLQPDDLVKACQGIVEDLVR